MKLRASKEKVNPKIRAKKPFSKASIDHVRYQEVINTYATVHSKHNSIIADQSYKQMNRHSKSPMAKKSFDSNDERSKIKLLKAPQQS